VHAVVLLLPLPPLLSGHLALELMLRNLVPKVVVHIDGIETVSAAM